jgi:hypothetical protein
MRPQSSVGASVVVLAGAVVAGAVVAGAVVVDVAGTVVVIVVAATAVVEGAAPSGDAVHATINGITINANGRLRTRAVCQGNRRTGVR